MYHVYCIMYKKCRRNMWTCDRWILVDKASTIGVSPLSLNRHRPPIEVCIILNTIVCYCIVMYSMCICHFCTQIKRPPIGDANPCKATHLLLQRGAQKIKKGGLAQKYKFSRNIKRLAACTISISLETTNYHRQTTYCFRSWYFFWYWTIWHWMQSRLCKYFIFFRCQAPESFT